MILQRITPRKISHVLSEKFISPWKISPWKSEKKESMYFSGEACYSFRWCCKIGICGKIFRVIMVIMCHHVPSEFPVCNHPSTLAKNDCFAISERTIFFALFAGKIHFNQSRKKNMNGVCECCLIFSTWSNNGIIIIQYYTWLYNHISIIIMTTFPLSYFFLHIIHGNSSMGIAHQAAVRFRKSNEQISLAEMPLGCEVKPPNDLRGLP